MGVLEVGVADGALVGRRVGAALGAGVAGTQIRVILSALPVAKEAPSGLKATDSTRPISPPRYWSSAPVVASQSRALPSELPVAKVVPSGLNATPYTFDGHFAKAVPSTPAVGLE